MKRVFLAIALTLGVMGANAQNVEQPETEVVTFQADTYPQEMSGDDYNGLTKKLTTNMYRTVCVGQSGCDGGSFEFIFHCIMSVGAYTGIVTAVALESAVPSDPMRLIISIVEPRYKVRSTFSVLLLSSSGLPPV